ncbi:MULTISPECIES: rRNA pseudouridine synthase [Pseudomonas]|nr:MULTISPECIES: rRNA pseudouridine synthase [Pseudomonas]AHF66448.1 S4 domain-containing protein [Pseudomonas cichorii JBC1]MBI6852338.1 rRNA pseudouridine synthase [Pseudomonas cichorii]MBX8485461.1 rRNA pseudouridine synthase [Pseudomonas cichorii]MBX8497405.1 rRNA pseudouridine synthase [Pseudomonas cichorii]MBX8499017.1 rRNA pseudouridine synthase [Pseudomonas lijiangensis]
MTDPIRLSKRLIELVGCSRREAELYIEGGWVTVDGEVVEEPQFKVENQKVELSPDARAETPEAVTIILHKPASASVESALQMITPGTLSQEHSFGKRPLKGHFLRLEAISTLQANASGLMVFSQDWKILRKLTDDRSKIEQEYVVEVSGEMVAHGLNRLNHGLSYKGKELPAVKASWQNENRLRFAMKNPQPGIIAQLCEAVGLKIVAVRRIRIGGVSMGKLPEGQWRYMTAKEKF